MTAGATFTTNPYQFASLPYRVEDLAPVSLITRLPFALLARLSLARVLDEFVAPAGSDPDRLNYGTTSRGSFARLSGVIVGGAIGIA